MFGKVNQSYGRTRTLWDSRYHSSLITTDEYLLATYRYIELNPVRAGTVRNPADYRWSSYSTNALGRITRLSPHASYLALGNGEAARRNAYRRLLETEPDSETTDEIRRALNQCQPVGQRELQSKLREREIRKNARLEPGST